MLNNRKLHFAVGLTAIIIAIRWLLTGDLLMAVEAARPPAEGETKSIALLSVLGPMLIEACVIVGASIIAWVLKLWQWLSDVIDNVSDKANPARADPAPTAPEPTALAEGSFNGPTAAVPVERTDPQALVAALAQAVAVGDTEAETQCRKEIRKPYLRVELSESISTANYARAREIIAELEAMNRPAEPTALAEGSSSTEGRKLARRTRATQGGNNEQK